MTRSDYILQDIRLCIPDNSVEVSLHEGTLHFTRGKVRVEAPLGLFDSGMARYATPVVLKKLYLYSNLEATRPRNTSNL